MTSDDTAKCPECNNQMSQIGWDSMAIPPTPLYRCMVCDPIVSQESRIAELTADNARLTKRLNVCLDWIKATPGREVAFRNDTKQFGNDDLAGQKGDEW